MFFVPIVPAHHEPPSPRTRELAGLLARVIEEYEKHHPSVTGSEVRAALSMAARGSRSATPEQVRRLLALGAGVLVAVLGVGVFLLSSQGGSAPAVPMVAVAVGIFAAVVAVGVLVRRSAGR